MYHSGLRQLWVNIYLAITSHKKHLCTLWITCCFVKYSNVKQGLIQYFLSSVLLNKPRYCLFPALTPNSRGETVPTGAINTSLSVLKEHGNSEKKSEREQSQARLHGNKRVVCNKPLICPSEKMDGFLCLCSDRPQTKRLFLFIPLKSV